MYVLPSTTGVLQHIAAFTASDWPPPSDSINNVYKLPSIERSVRYLHGAVGFPTKKNWLQGIRKGKYLTWPLITIKNFNKHFPESEETQKGHMQNLCVGVRCTKNNPPLALSPTPPAIHTLPTKYIFITVDDPRKTILTNQTSKFTLRSSRGNQYQIIVYVINIGFS